MAKNTYSASKFSETPTHIEIEKKIRKILKNKIPSESDRINILYDLATKEIADFINREDIRNNKPYLEAVKTLLQTYTYTLLTLINKDIDAAIIFQNQAKIQLTDKYTGHTFKLGKEKRIDP